MLSSSREGVSEGFLMAGLPVAPLASAGMLGCGWKRTWRFDRWSERDDGICSLALGSGLGSTGLGLGIFSWQLALGDLVRDVGGHGWRSGGDGR